MRNMKFCAQAALRGIVRTFEGFIESGVRMPVFRHRIDAYFRLAAAKYCASNKIEEWFSAAASGKYFVSESSVFSSIDTVSLIFTVPVYMGDNITGVLSMIGSSDFSRKKSAP